MGLEQEFFLVDGDGVVSDRADDFLERCWEIAGEAGLDPENFAPECVKNLVEVSTPPAASLEDLSEAYLTSVETALRAAKEIGLRLYPLATYPLRITPILREADHYRLQSRTLGPEKFLHAGRCAGVHLHLEVAPEAIDERVGVAYDCPPEDRRELLNVYNLATALDPAIIALTKACPFYEGRMTEIAARTAYYRGSPRLAPYGLYGELEEVGGLRPYAEDAERLVELQFGRYHAWLSAMDRAGVGRRLFFEAGDGMLDAAWNPVRLNGHGTVELRGIDSGYPAVVLETSALIRAVARRVAEEDLTVTPVAGLMTFEVEGRSLLVPGFEDLDVDLFREAATLGAASTEVVAYLDSILEFANIEAEDLKNLKPDGEYRCPETKILEDFGVEVSQDTGLRIVREACDELEEQIHYLQNRQKTTSAKAGADEN
ncbi:MAG: glutamate-cysteine ligase family protein [Rubrobacteraceae bacterium]